MLNKVSLPYTTLTRNWYIDMLLKIMYFLDFSVLNFFMLKEYINVSLTIFIDISLFKMLFSNGHDIILSKF
jgi:hypothetical protein